MQFLESQNEGNRIISLWCNVGFHSEMEKAINAIGNIFSKNEIKSVLYNVAVLGNGPLRALIVSQFEKVLNPKISGK